MSYRVRSARQFTMIMIFAPGNGAPQLDRVIYVFADEYRHPVPVVPSIPDQS